MEGIQQYLEKVPKGEGIGVKISDCLIFLLNNPYHPFFRYLAANKIRLIADLAAANIPSTASRFLETYLQALPPIFGITYAVMSVSAQQFAEEELPQIVEAAKNYPHTIIWVNANLTQNGPNPEWTLQIADILETVKSGPLYNIGHAVSLSDAAALRQTFPDAFIQIWGLRLPGDPKHDHNADRMVGAVNDQGDNTIYTLGRPLTRPSKGRTYAEALEEAQQYFHIGPSG